MRAAVVGRGFGGVGGDGGGLRVRRCCLGCDCAQGERRARGGMPCRWGAGEFGRGGGWGGGGRSGGRVVVVLGSVMVLVQVVL